MSVRVLVACLGGIPAECFAKHPVRSIVLALADFRISGIIVKRIAAEIILSVLNLCVVVRIGAKSANDVHRVAAVWAYDYTPVALHNVLLQSRKEVLYHLPKIPRITDDTNNSRRIYIVNQPAECLYLVRLAACTHHRMFSSRNSGGHQLRLCISIVVFLQCTDSGDCLAAAERSQVCHA